MAGINDAVKELLAEGRATSTPEETEKAVDTTKSQTEKEESAADQPKRTLFVRSLPPSATTESLAEHFSQSYIIKHALVVKDSETKLSKGYGFVTFADVEDAKAALEEFNKSVYDGKKIIVEYAQQRHRTIDETLGKSVPAEAALDFKKQREQQREATQPPRLIVRNLPWSIKEPEDLSVLFRSFGKVKQAILPKKGNVLAGFGFVVLRGKKNAEKALASVNGKEVDGRTLAVDWAVQKDVWDKLQKEDDAQEEDKVEEKKDVEMADDAEAPKADSDEEEGIHVVGESDIEDDADEDEEEDDDEDMDLDLDEDEDEDDQANKEDERDACTIFIRNLPFTCTDETLYEHFTQFGNLRYARIVVDHDTGRPRGTGFVCFWKVDDAAECLRDAPKQQDNFAMEKDKKDKSKKSNTLYKHSVLQNENSDPSGRYTMDGRVLQLSRAVSKSRASELEEEGASRRMVRDTDKRRLYLLAEGTVPHDSPLYKHLSPSEIKMREDSYKQRQSFIKKNPTLHLSLTRLSIRNIPRHVTSKDLKQLARQAVVGFAKDVGAGRRQPLSKEEVHRAAEEMREAEKLRKSKGAGVVRQSKIVFESKEGSKISEDSSAGRSRGYGFIEYYTHRHALMGLRWLNGHAVEAPKTGVEDAQDKKKRLVVEFAIENAQVVKRRNEQQARARDFPKRGNKDENTDGKPDFKKGPPRGRGGQGQGRGRPGQEHRRGRPGQEQGQGQGQGQDQGQKRKRTESKEGGDSDEQNKLAKRNRIIARKRMQRRNRK